MFIIKTKYRFLSILNPNCYQKVFFSSKSYKVDTKLNQLLNKMPKERKHIADAQKQRQKIKERGSRYVPGTVNLQVLGNGSPSAPASVYLFTDQNRYLFNCGEGTQRLAHEHKTKLSRLEHIFITRTSWDRLGGLPGLSLTVQDAGVPDLTLHGPPGLDEIFCGMRRFVVLKDLKVHTINCANGEEFEDQVLNVNSIPLKISVDEHDIEMEERSPETEVVEMDNTDYYSYENQRNSRNSPSQERQKNFCDNLPKREEHVVCAYICKLKPKCGSLNLEKCVEKGVPPGPLLGQLKNGFDVTLADGTFVKADDVRAPTDPGPVFIFLDVPSEKYLQSLEENSKHFEKYQSNSEHKDERAVIVVHFTPQNIINSEVYMNFINKFSESTKHLVLNSTNKFSGYLAAHRIQCQLNQISENIFPLLKEKVDLQAPAQNLYKKRKLSPESDCNGKTDSNNLNPNNYTESSNFIDNIISLTSYYLRPLKGIVRSYEPILSPDDYIRETQEIKGFTESLAKLKNELAVRYRNETDHVSNKYPQIVFLGTGSCIPNKTRNVSSILVHTSESSCMLLDCGEGTLGQITRFYGEDEIENILKKLKAIYISHLHADHHIGLIGILKHRQKLEPNLPPLMLLAPKQIQFWLNFYNQRIESIAREYFLVPNADLITTPYSTSYTQDMSIRSISTCLVRHCPHSFGVSIAMENYDKSDIFKITYSGDTMPCNDLVELGKNSTILIHEATMEDELSNEAVYKMHSTISQAIQQGQKMNAQFTILTHFSQRYAKLPRFENFVENVGIAFDNMQVCLNDLKHLHLMNPTLILMFSEHWEEMEQKALKRAQKKERKRLASIDDKHVDTIS